MQPETNPEVRIGALPAGINIVSRSLLEENSGFRFGVSVKGGEI